MAVDKLVDSTQLDSDLTSVANAIRTKGGTSAQLAFPAGFVSAIGDIQTGGLSIQPPYKVASGSVTPVSNTQTLTVDVTASGITELCGAFIICEDIVNYATKYLDSAPVYIRGNHHNIYPLNAAGAGFGLTMTIFNDDGTISNTGNGNWWGLNNGTMTFGTYTANGFYKPGVTYSYVVVGV